MANATITLTVSESWDDGKRIHVIGSLAISPASDVYVAGGLAIPLPTAPAINPNTKPISFSAQGLAGYLFFFDRANSKLKIMAMKTTPANYDPLIEINAAAIPAALSGDTITFDATYRKFAE